MGSEVVRAGSLNVSSSEEDDGDQKQSTHRRGASAGSSSSSCSIAISAMSMNSMSDYGVVNGVYAVISGNGAVFSDDDRMALAALNDSDSEPTEGSTNMIGADADDMVLVD